jgi:hypothetical protein
MERCAETDRPSEQLHKGHRGLAWQATPAVMCADHVGIRQLRAMPHPLLRSRTLLRLRQRRRLVTMHIPRGAAVRYTPRSEPRRAVRV